ncbi:tRNA lysidine(34) synthetase [Aestuariimicrobium soli]|uniref:tRNA lysidine(34) synthetase n=1 Tax=Aestuariimicrobium soli TaxID=2035834 RepID=UPI003EC01DE1
MAARTLSQAQLRVVGAVQAGRESGALGPGAVVLGVSGGADSLAMAAAVAWCGESLRRRGLPVPAIEAVVVDHGLQPGSGEVAEKARQQVLGLGLDCRVVSGEVPRGDAGPEAAARDLRRRLLAEVAEQHRAEMASPCEFLPPDGKNSQGNAVMDRCGSGRRESGRRESGRRESGQCESGRGEHQPGAAPVEIWLAHTRDDVAEQVLLGLARGSGARSLAGIPPRQRLVPGVEWVRPLLGVTRAETRQACLDGGLTPWDDPHNDDPRFTRVRVRSRVLPALERELGPGIADALARSADLLRDDADLLDTLTAGWLREASERDDLRVAALVDQPAARVSRVVRAWLLERGVGQPTRAQVMAVADLVTRWHGQGGVDLAGGRVTRRGPHLVFKR